MRADWLQVRSGVELAVDAVGGVAAAFERASEIPERVGSGRAFADALLGFLAEARPHG